LPTHSSSSNHNNSGGACRFAARRRGGCGGRRSSRRWRPEITYGRLRVTQLRMAVLVVYDSSEDIAIENRDEGIAQERA